VHRILPRRKELFFLKVSESIAPISGRRAPDGGSLPCDQFLRCARNERIFRAKASVAQYRTQFIGALSETTAAGASSLTHRRSPIVTAGIVAQTGKTDALRPSAKRQNPTRRDWRWKN
jgi:hypothetical protein